MERAGAPPVWAGFCALINEARVNAGMSPLPYANPLLYPLLGTACFRDIIGGSNGAYAAATGYDLVTGLGAPNVKALVAQLVRVRPAASAKPAPSAKLAHVS